jgi:hypothetical protein
MIVVNNLFLKNCVKLLKKYPTETDPISNELEELLANGIVKAGDCYFFKSLFEANPPQEIMNQVDMSEMDKTYIELKHNEINLRDYGFPYAKFDFNKKGKATKMLKMGIITSLRLANILKPMGAFCVRYAFNFDTETKVLSSFISFNKWRDGAAGFYNMAPNYDLHGVMIIKNSIDNDNNMLFINQYKLPDLFRTKDLQEFNKWVSVNSNSEIEGRDIMFMTGNAIHWLSFFEIVCLPFHELDAYEIQLASLVQNDPRKSEFPQAFFQQLALSFELVWLLQLRRYYKDGNWAIQIENWESSDITIRVTIKKPYSSVTDNNIFSTPRAFRLKDLPEYQEIRVLNPNTLPDAQQVASHYGTGILWLSFFETLFPDFDNNFELFWVSYITCNHKRKERLPQPFYQQMALYLRMFWTLQAENLFPNGDWEVFIDGWKDEIILDAEIYRRNKLF